MRTGMERKTGGIWRKGPNYGKTNWNADKILREGRERTREFGKNIMELIHEQKPIQIRERMGWGYKYIKNKVMRLQERKTGHVTTEKNKGERNIRTSYTVKKK